VKGIDCNQLPEVVSSPPTYCTHWVEKIFVGDHGDAPKDCYTIQLAVKTGLAEVRENRKVRQVRVISDTGGENWGTKALAQYANWPALHECEVVWCPTAANHSGQPSDGAGGEFKRRIMSLALAGELRGVNSAEDLVNYLERESIGFSEVKQTRFLRATTTKRTYHLLTKAKVDSLGKITIAPLPGVSQWKQVFSCHGNLLARPRPCACAPCIDRLWEECESKNHVEAPVKLEVTLLASVPEVLEACETSSVKVHYVADNTDSLMIECGSFYAARGEDGPVIFRCDSVMGDTISGAVMHPKDTASGRYLQLEVHHITY